MSNVMACPGCKAADYKSRCIVKSWTTEDGLKMGWCVTCGTLMFKETDAIHCILPESIEQLVEQSKKAN